MKNFWKTVFARMVGVLALVLVGVMIYSAATRGVASIPATLTGIFVTPVQTLTAYLSDGVSGFVGSLTGTGDLRERLEALEAENAKLRQQMVDYDQMKQENDWYNEILGLHEEHSDYTFASGRVIGRDPLDVYGNFTISAGSNAHIHVNDPVITPDGVLVGVVQEVGLTYAKVRTVLDPATKVAAQISRTADTAYTAGATINQARGGLLRLTMLERSSGAAIGDYVITSGIGGVYPAGLQIGTVKSVTGATDGMTLDAEIDLLADIYDLKQVMIITSFDGQGGE